MDVDSMWFKYFTEVRCWKSVPDQVSSETAKEFANWVALQPDFRPDVDKEA